MEPWFVLWSFLLLRLLCISNIPYGQVWNTALLSGLVLLVVNLEFLGKLEKWICKTVGPWLVASLNPLGLCWNIVSLSLFYRYYFGRCSSELTELVPIPYCGGMPTHYSDRLHDFFVTIPRCYKDLYVNSFFPRTARPWNSLPLECFPLTYDLSGFKSRINRYLLTVGSF